MDNKHIIDGIDVSDCRFKTIDDRCIILKTCEGTMCVYKHCKSILDNSSK